jgi:hypothetical protein
MVGCQIIGKGVYKQMSSSAVHDVEKQKLTTHCIYYVIKNHMLMRKQLLNIIKLIAFPEISNDFTCNYYYYYLLYQTYKALFSYLKPVQKRCT